jgi:hypothetical protein
MLRSVALPGWGQIYVEHYWRSAIFFGAAGALWYNTISNHIQYRKEQDKMNSISDKESYDYQLAKARRDTYVDNRDLSGLYLLGVYAISIIDAYAGANLYDFNVSDDLNITLLPFNTNVPYQPGISFNITYKLN